jgi:uncharacterized protein YydD (DUF2326 family)
MKKSATTLLAINNALKGLGQDMFENKNKNIDEFRETNDEYNNIQENIKSLTNKQVTDTLHKQVTDTFLLKKSTDLRLLVWGILAIGFGLTALKKIRDL